MGLVKDKNDIFIVVHDAFLNSLLAILDGISDINNRKYRKYGVDKINELIEQLKTTFNYFADSGL